jgi:DNA/RNA-binding domain of Phe-tRNA-synthetase-like protein
MVFDMLTMMTTNGWRSNHPGAFIGIIELSGVHNKQPSPALDQFKRETEARLRATYQGFTRKDFLLLPVMAAYERYYKRFKKTYHVQLQVESIVLKARNLPSISPLVDANFAAEVETFVLTAGHDVAKLNGSIVFDVSNEDDSITQMNGVTRSIYANDMVMRDSGGVCCSIIYGQDNRSPISAETSEVLYVAYAPEGVPVEIVDNQLVTIERNIRLFSPTVKVEQRHLFPA